MADRSPDAPPHHRVVVVGAGFAGLGAAAGLLRAGVRDFVVLERAGDVGGTWRDNTYPGCACDIPSSLYSFSFAPNPDWSRFFPRQPEILDYLRRVTDDLGLRPHLRLATELLGAAWDDGSLLWRIETDRGQLTADVLVAAVGALSRPSLPGLPGLDRFGGPVFHSASWRHDVDLAGKRVAVVGTGASAVQIVPELAPVVERLVVVQRTPAWVGPRLDRPVSARQARLFRRFPPAQAAVRVVLYWLLELLGVGFTIDRRLLRPVEAEALRHLRRQVPDERLRAALTPHYAIGCKRILYSNDYYPALQRPGVELLASGLAELRPGALVTTGGQVREVDAVVLATGFAATEPAVAARITGRGGRALAAAWSGGMHAYLGTAVPGFPNLFLLVGPNSGLGHSSMVQVIESQVAHLLAGLRALASTGARSIEVRPDAEAAYNSRLQRRLRRTVWSTGGCASWYLDEHGRNTTLWPWSTWRFRLRARRLDRAAYVLR
ncbi:MAG: flavin-containing monooxygenase [Frankiaceae bacterium]